jgi:hypothetical protein
VPFLALVQGDEQADYAHKGGDDGWWYRQELAARGIADGIMAGSYRQRPLDAEGHGRNRAIAPLRAPVERTFAILKRWYGYGRVRYRSLVRNGLQPLALALNLRRTLALTARTAADDAGDRHRRGHDRPDCNQFATAPLRADHPPVPSQGRNKLRPYASSASRREDIPSDYLESTPMIRGGCGVMSTPTSLDPGCESSARSTVVARFATRRDALPSARPRRLS